MSKFISIKEASSLVGVSPQTLRRWERQGKIALPKRTNGGQRRYDVSQFLPKKKEAHKEITIAYARVSSHDQKEDLQRQQQMLEFFCTSNGWTFEMISDLGSGLNYSKKGLRKLLTRIIDGGLNRLVFDS